MDKKFNIYRLYDKIVITDDTPHALENYIADTYGYDPEDDEDCERVVEILDEDVLDIAHDLSIENIDIASIEDFSNDCHAVVYEN